MAINDTQFDLVVIGTGFASSFFLHEYLQHAPADARVLVLERGGRQTHDWQVENRRYGEIDQAGMYQGRGRDRKKWTFTIAFGGGSNCWWASTPRMMPADFRLQSLYGVGRDWPFDYDELESYYTEAEEIMQVAGPSDIGLFPRSKPYPQPPHRFNEPDRLMSADYPDTWVQLPTARARRAVAGGRPGCCANAVCNLCPVDAKFTIENGLAHLYEDPRVTLSLESQVLTVETQAGIASGVIFKRGGKEERAKGDLVALGTNALFNPLILQNSGFDHPLLGRRLHEQVGVGATVLLDGVDNFQGSTSITGHGYMLYDGPHRSEHAACLIESWNRPEFRAEAGRWRETMKLRFVFENLPSNDNRVEPSADDPTVPVAVFDDFSDYAYRGIRNLESILPDLLRPLPVEDIELRPVPSDTEAHILGTVVMGDDPEDSVVDDGMVHHSVRNLLVLGGSAFPTGAPANPTLTISALSLRAARKLATGSAS